MITKVFNLVQTNKQISKQTNKQTIPIIDKSELCVEYCGQDDESGYIFQSDTG